MAVRTLILALLMTASAWLRGQQLRFRHLTSEDGLSTNFVKTIAQDDRGFMWFGTQDGLNKYDGYQFHVFKSDPNDSSSLGNSEITAIRQLRSDLMVIGTRNGLSFFNALTGRFSAQSHEDQALLGKVYAVFPLDSSAALIGSDAGLFSLDLHNMSVKALPFAGGAMPPVKCIERSGGKIYVGTLGKGLWIYDPQKREAVKAVLLIPDYVHIAQEQLEQINCLTEYGGKLYIGTAAAGVMKVGGNHEIERHFTFHEQNENADVIRDLLIRDNRMYVASAYGVLVCNLLSGQVSHYTRQENALSLNSNPCNCLYMDQENNLWVGTDLGGVNIAFFRSQKFPVSIFGYETYFDNIFALYETHPGTVLLGGVKSLYELDLETSTTIDHSPLLGSGTALCILRESDDIFWIGTWGNGLYRYDIRTKKSRNVLSNTQGGTIVSLLIHGGDLYAGSVGDGLFRINLATLKVTRFAESEGLPNLSVNCIFRDSKGYVWLGMYDGGLVKLRALPEEGTLGVEKHFMNTGRSGEIASNVVFAVNEDDGGTIWAATSGGLSRLQTDGTFHSYRERDGLQNAFLYSLVKDTLGHFWMSSNGGLIRFNPLQPENDLVFKNYGVKDGLVNTEYNMGAAFAASSGMMYFGGPRGFNAFRPSSIRDNMHAPPVYVVGYKRGGLDVATDTALSYKRHLKLSWKENYFQFEVVALDYTDPSKNKFRYKLEGYDNEWSSPTNVRYVSYTELPGGTYTFMVKAANNDGVWNDTPAALVITVVPPFWKTTAFYIFVALLALGAVFGFIHYRTRAVKLENRVLEMKVAERTRELEARNRDITSSIEYARRIQEAILPSREHIFRKLKKVFILYRPKDIVSGDFYWFGEKNGVKIFAVVDCTGHGVPGAFMSMIGHNLLHQVVNEQGVTDPAEILDLLHSGVQKALRQGHNEVNTNDGMDVSLITINDSAREVKWAGANRPLILIDHDGNFTRYEGDKFPVGGAQLNTERKFTAHVIKPQIAAMAYMFSDGYADQFGGEKGKKYMVKRFHQLLLNIHRLPPETQQTQLEAEFEAWRKNHEQVDDVLIAGVEV